MLRAPSVAQNVLKLPGRSSVFFNATATTEIYTLSLHDALPICLFVHSPVAPDVELRREINALGEVRDRKSTRLNSSHVSISYAVFCLKKKKNPNTSNRYYTQLKSIDMY